MAIVDEIRAEYERHSSKENMMNAQQFFKEKLKNPWVLRSAVVRKIAEEGFRTLEGKEKDEIFDLCGELLEGGFSTVAFDWVFRCRRHYEKKDFAAFEKWLKRYVSDWGGCDDFCTRALGFFLLDFPEFIPNLKKWAKTENLWLKRASAVALIPSLRRGKALPDAFEIAEILLIDKEDLAQKGYGWMLKEASNRYPDEVFEFVMRRKDIMPRTALRYAIEKLPDEKRKEAMKK